MARKLQLHFDCSINFMARFLSSFPFLFKLEMQLSSFKFQACCVRTYTIHAVPWAVAIITIICGLKCGMPGKKNWHKKNYVNKTFPEDFVKDYFNKLWNGTVSRNDGVLGFSKLFFPPFFFLPPSCQWRLTDVPDLHMLHLFWQIRKKEQVLVASFNLPSGSSASSSGSQQRPSAGWFNVKLSDAKAAVASGAERWHLQRGEATLGVKEQPLTPLLMKRSA